MSRINLAPALRHCQAGIQCLQKEITNNNGSPTNSGNAANSNNGGVISSESTTEPDSPTPTPQRIDLDQIFTTYQVEDDPGGMVSLTFAGMPTVTASERDVVRGAGLTTEYLLYSSDAWALARLRDDRPGENPAWDGGHSDAFRHTLWNALLVQNTTEAFARDVTTAHERNPGNDPNREAMDLYNNEVGRQIAIDNPDATKIELIELIEEALENGQLLVLDLNDKLIWSDGQPIETTGPPTPIPNSPTWPDFGGFQDLDDYGVLAGPVLSDFTNTSLGTFENIGMGTGFNDELPQTDSLLSSGQGGFGQGEDDGFGTPDYFGDEPNIFDQMGDAIGNFWDNLTSSFDSNNDGPELGGKPTQEETIVDPAQGGFGQGEDDGFGTPDYFGAPNDNSNPSSGDADDIEAAREAATQAAQEAAAQEARAAAALQESESDTEQREQEQQEQQEQEEEEEEETTEEIGGGGYHEAAQGN